MDKLTQYPDIMRYVMTFHISKTKKYKQIIEFNLVDYKENSTASETEITEIRKEIYKVWDFCKNNYDDDVFYAYIEYCEEDDIIPDITVDRFTESFYGWFSSIDDFIDEWIDDMEIEISPWIILDYKAMWEDKLSLSYFHQYYDGNYYMFKREF